MGPAHIHTVHSTSYILQLLTPYPIPIQPTHYDEKGRQSQYIESTIQRRERIAFLKKREWARRMALWMNESAIVYSNAAPPLTPPVDHAYTGCKSPSLYSGNTTDYYDPDSTEPYIIYSSSPSPRNTPTPPSPPRPTISPSRMSAGADHRRRTTSLSSISEMPEED